MTPNTLNRSRFMFFYFLSGFCTRKRTEIENAATMPSRIHRESIEIQWILGGIVAAFSNSVRFASTEPTQKVEKHETASIQGVWGHRRP